MSVKERDRLKVVAAVRKRHMSRKQAAEELGVSTRWLRKLLERMAEEGDRGVMHKGVAFHFVHDVPEEHAWTAKGLEVEAHVHEYGGAGIHRMRPMSGSSRSRERSAIFRVHEGGK